MNETKVRRVSAPSRIALAIAVDALAGLLAATLAGARSYKRSPTGQNQWYWEIGPPPPGLAGLPAISAPYPKPGSATICDTDLFQDSNRARAGIPTARSPVVAALHAAGKYSICYVEVGAYQTSFPDDANSAPADYGHAAHRYRMQGYPNECWFNIAGFRDYVAGRSSTLSGVAVNIGAALDRRFRWCKREGQDAVEPDDLDGYANRSVTGVPGGGRHVTLNAEYTQDGETTARFCAADLAAGITGALFEVGLGRSTYRPCAPADHAGR